MLQWQDAVQPLSGDGCDGGLQPSPSRICSAVASAKELPRREDRSPAEPETRNPKLEIRNKSKFTGIGQWANGKPSRFIAGSEQSRLL